MNSQGLFDCIVAHTENIVHIIREAVAEGVVLA
ncbi:hypothetical protein J3E06_001027 [Methanococcus voltae]|nr:hypothetical protein [Methanococcus voltae]